MRIIITLFICFISLFSGAQTNFYKQFSGNGYDYAYGVIELPDSSYMITGSSSSFVDGPSQMFLLHIDSLGQFIWSHSYGQGGSDAGQRVKRLSTGEYFVGGFTNSSGEGAYDMALWKIAENGELIWFKTFGSEAWERINDIVLTEDDGLIIVGETDNTIDGHTDAYVLRVDQNGIVIWEKQYENPGEDNVFTIEKIAPDIYAIGGTKYNSSTEKNEGWISKIDGNGNDIWNQNISLPNHTFIRDLIITGSKIYCTGYTTIDVLDSAYMLIVALNENDGSVSVQTIDHFIGTTGMHLANFEYIDAAAIGTSRLGSSTFGLEDNLFFGFASSGYYYKTIGTVQYASSQVLGDMYTTYNRGVIAVGYNRHIGPGGSSIYVFRAGNNQPLLHANDDMSPEPIVSITTANKLESLSIYPNPTTGILKIKNQDNFKLSITITDLLGNNVAIDQNITNNSIDISNLSPGMYYIQLTDVNSKLTQVFKVQNIK